MFIGHRGSLLPRRFVTSESRGARVDLTAGVERPWSVSLVPLGATQGPLGAPLEQSPAERPHAQVPAVPG